ncbi:putative ribonuclease H-like domain-containing protein [Tanacetum coccineum]
MWRLRIHQYFQVQDYVLWDVIENGNSFKPTTRTTTNADGTSTSMIPGPVTIEEKAQKKNDVKARSMLLMALPNEHQLTFNQYKDSKTLFDAIQTRFGGNVATRKTQKTLLKLQKIVSQLAFLGESISQEDLNLKFLRSLPSEWNTHVVVWRNKSDLDTMSIDDLYNNFKIVEQEVKRTVTSSSSSQNMAFVSSPNSTNEVNTDNVHFSTANSPISTADTSDSTANLNDIEKMDLKWQLALLSMRARRYFQRTRKKITINRSDTAGYDKSKVECFNCHKMGHFARECRDEEVPTNMALMAFLDLEVHNDKTCTNTCHKSFETLKTQYDNLRIEFNKSEFNLATYKRGLAFVKEQLVFYKKNEVMFCDQIVVLKRDTTFKDSEINALKSEIEKFKKEKESNQIKIDKFENASKSLDKLIRSQIFDNIRKGMGFVSYNAVPHPPTGLFAPPTIDLSNSGLEEFQQPELEGYGPKVSKSICKDTSNEVKKNSDVPLGKKLVLEKEKQTVFPTKIESLKKQEKPARKPVKLTAITIKGKGWPVNTDHLKTIVYRARSMSCFPKLAQSHVKRPYESRTTLTNKNSNQKVNIAKEKVYTAKPKAVNTARPTSAVVNVVRANQGHSQKEDQGYVDSGCSRHMTDNMSYLLNFKEFDGGYDTFGGGARGRRITGKGTLKTGNLDFKDVYFVKELQFNLFSVSQMCDKKNIVLFTDTICFVLSPDFKLPDESQVLLKVPKKNNMYSVDMKNIVPKESLICFVAKATLNESMLWHRRLGHINFKIINKLVKDNLVWGLPVKRFENDQTCIACLKGKQHKASYSLRCDNRTEFKNRVMNEFCEKKGIKREFSVARTPQQNSVAERRNRTLIEDARTMLADFKLPTTFWVEAVNTACYRIGCHVTILNTLDHLGKFDGKSDDGFFVGYSLTSKAFRVYNIRTRKVEENLHIRFLENKPIITGDGPKWLFDNDSLTKLMNYVPVVAGTNSNDFAGSKESNDAGHTSKETELSQDYIVMPLWKDGLLFESSSKNSSDDEPQPFSNAEKKDDEGILVDLPKGKRAIGTKWIFRNKKDERGIVKRNKAMLVSQGYTQEEGIDYDDVFTPVARIEAIRLFLVYASYMGFMVYQMDVKSALLYGTIEEEVYVCQPPGFEDPDYPDKVYKVVNALYGLH